MAHELTSPKRVSLIFNASAPDMEGRNEAVLRRIAETNQTHFAYILLYNSIENGGNASHAIDKLSEMHANMMGLHGFMAGFQFFVLESASDTRSTLEEAILAIRFVGFAASLGGTLISLIAQEYLKGIELEDLEFQVEGILKYESFFRSSGQLAVVASLTLATTATMGIYGGLDNRLFWFLASLFGLSIVFGAFKCWQIILKKQTYGGRTRHLYMYDMSKHY